MPNATAGSIFDRQSNRIQEVLNKSMRVFLAGLDPVWRDNVVTSQGVGNSGDLGRDLKITKLFMGSLTGVIESGRSFGEQDLYGSGTSSIGPLMHLQSTSQAYPSPLEGPNATAYRLAVPMRSLVTNLMITLGEKQADATPALIDQVIAPKLTAFARNMAHTLCNYWYLSQNDSYRLCQMSNSEVRSVSSSTGPTGTTTSTYYQIRFNPSNQATHRFARGQRVDIVYSSGLRANDDTAPTAVVGSQTRSTRRQLIVENVDPLTNQVVLVTTTDPNTTFLDSAGAQVSGTAVTTTYAAQTDFNSGYIVYANATINASNVGSNTFVGIAGINSWLKNGYETSSTKLLGAESDSTDFIDVAERPEFKSFKYAVNGVLTEYNLKRYLQRVHSAFEPLGHTIDTLIASEGVWSAYESQKIGQYRIDRTNRVASITNEGQAEGFSFSFEGKTYKGHTSRFVEAGTLYGIKLGGKNWKKYVPPSPAGMSKMSQADAYVPFEFVAGAITGTSTNQLPVYLTTSTSSGSNANLVTQASQMPGRIRMQLVPDQVNGMKLTGITEDRVYMDTTDIA
jgi:hypothetical protein